MADKKNTPKKTAAEKKSNFDKLLNTAFNTPAKKKAVTKQPKK